jgi:excisionase family DNA binding protein
MPELLSPAEAAQVLGVPEADVLAVLDSGELKGRKIGSTWRIPRAAITTYLGS